MEQEGFRNEVFSAVGSGRGHLGWQPPLVLGRVFGATLGWNPALYSQRSFALWCRGRNRR